MGAPPLERDERRQPRRRIAGFSSCPSRSPDDLFFDIEGDPFALDDGVEYLFGILEPGAETDPRWRAAGPPPPAFHEIWSRDDDGQVTWAAEKAAFERTVDLLIDRLERDPRCTSTTTRPTSGPRWAGSPSATATREEEVDRLLRGGVLVDLFRVVRQGIRASVESYSIKRLEPLYGLEREVELQGRRLEHRRVRGLARAGRPRSGRGRRSILAGSRATTATTS